MSQPFFRGCFNLWVILGALLLGLIMLSATVTLVWFNRPVPTPVAASTAVLNIIPAPTSTPIPPTPTRTPVPTEIAATQGIPPSPPPGSITVGAFVQITGTEGDGLRLRSAPGLEAPIRLLGAESEVFRVEDGPQDVDGYTWYYLVGPYDETRTGWAVSNYLAVVQNR